MGAVALGATLSLTPTAPALAAEQSTNTVVRSDQDFHAYLNAGETLNATFTKTVENPDGADTTLTVKGPGGVDKTCTIPADAAAGQNCSFSGLSSSQTGVWEVIFGTEGSSPTRPLRM